MKKTLMSITAAILSLTFATLYAGDRKQGDEFNGYWMLHLRGGIGQTAGETGYWDLISPSASIGFGYQFTPVWGLRADFSGWQAKGAIGVPSTLYKFNYIQGTADVLVDICNIFASYKVKRTLNPYLLVGVGANGRFNNNGASAVKDQFVEGYYWESSKISAAGRAGIGLDIRLCNALNLNIELNTNILSDRFNSKKGSIVDFQSNALIGLKFNFGKGRKEKATALRPAPAPAPAPAHEPEPEQKPEAKPEPQPQPAPKPEAAVEKAKVDVTENIFFTIGKWELRADETAKLDRLASVLCENPSASVTVTGYADVETGSAKRNMYLSQKRAESVASYLESKGVSIERISIAYKGSTERPYDTPSMNRVAICVAR